MIFQKNCIATVAFLVLSSVTGLWGKPPSLLQQVYGKKDKIMCVTIPKAGTHLLIKCLTLLGIDGIQFDYNEQKNIKDRKQSNYQKISAKEFAGLAFERLSRRILINKGVRRGFLVHLPFAPKYIPFFSECTEKNFLMIRDPRDQLISLASTAIQDPQNRQEYLPEILLSLLEGKHKAKPWSPYHVAIDLVWSIGIVKFYQSFLKWAEQPNFYVVRFENLVGSEGGGDQDLQINEIKKIARHLGVKVSSKKIHEVTKSLFGKSQTFKEGQANSWQRYFTPEVKQAFKAVPGACQLLIALGYEKDCNW